MFLVFDIGGTKMRMATSKDLKSLTNIKIVETPKLYSEGIGVFKNYIETLPEGSKLSSCAGGLQGVLDKSQSVLVSPPDHSSFPDWREKPLKIDLQNLVGGPVFLENDAAMVGLGEATFGTGKGYNIVAYITVSTGVGGVRIVGGEIDKKALGFEPGNQILFFDKSKLNESFDSVITLDHYISGSAIEKRMGKRAQEIEDADFWDEEERLLAIGLNNTIVHWSPDILVLGGSVMKTIDIEKVKEYFRQILTVFPTLPIIEKSSLEDDGGLYGGLAILNQKSK